MAAANADMSRAWDGPDGARWARGAERYDTAIGDYHDDLSEAAAIRGGEVVLDVGCGCGWSSVAAGRAGAARVLGVDLSREMLGVARARARAAGLDQVAFERADVQVHRLDAAAFDVAISSFGVMFFDDPIAAFANIARALRPNGRLAFVAWSALDRNEWQAALRDALDLGRHLPPPPPDAPGPFSFADADRTEALLGAAGFTGIRSRAVERRFRAGTDPDDAFEFLRETGPVVGLTDGLDEAARTAALAELRASLVAHDGPDGVTFGSSAWVVTATRA